MSASTASTVAASKPRSFMVRVASDIQFRIHEAAKVYDDPAAGIDERYQVVGLQATMSELSILYVPAGIEESRQYVGRQATMSALDIEYVPAGIEMRYQDVGRQATMSALDIEYVPAGIE